MFLDTRHLPWRVDGATFDEEGYYLCALVREWSVGRFAPDGRLVRLPVRYPTMCCFGGGDLDVMYLAAGRDWLKPTIKHQNSSCNRA